MGYCRLHIEDHFLDSRHDVDDDKLDLSFTSFVVFAWHLSYWRRGDSQALQAVMGDHE